LFILPPYFVDQSHGAQAYFANFYFNYWVRLYISFIRLKLKNQKRTSTNVPFIAHIVKR
jgi:hypothetical protein